MAAKKLVKPLGHQKSEITKRKTTGRHSKCGDFTIPHQMIQYQFHKHKYVFLFETLNFYKLSEFKFLLLKSRGDLNNKWFLKYLGFDQICSELTFIARANKVYSFWVRIFQNFKLHPSFGWLKKKSLRKWKMSKSNENLVFF